MINPYITEEDATAELRDELGKFATFLQERGDSEADMRLRKRLKPRVEAILTSPTPGERMGFVELIALLCSVMATIFSQEMGKDRQRLYEALEANISKRIREFYELPDGNGREAVAQLRAAKKDDWFRLVGGIQSQAVVRPEVNPWGVLAVGGSPTQAHEAMAFERARNAALLTYRPSDLPKEVRWGWVGARVLEVYLRTLAFAKRDAKGFESFDRINGAIEDLISFATRRNWEVPQVVISEAAATAAEKRAAPSAANPEVAATATEEKAETPVEPGAAATATGETPAMTLDEAVEVAFVNCPVEGRERILSDFSDSADLLKHEEKARNFYAGTFGEKFTDALFAAARGEIGPPANNNAEKAGAAVDPEAAATATEEKAETPAEEPEVAATATKPRRRQTPSTPKKAGAAVDPEAAATATEEKAETPAEEPEVAATATKPRRRQTPSTPKRAVVTQAGNDLASALASAGLTPKKLRAHSIAEKAVEWLSGKIPESTVRPVSQSVAHGAIEGKVDLLDRQSILDWLSGDGKILGVGSARAEKAAAILSKAGGWQ